MMVNSNGNYLTAWHVSAYQVFISLSLSLSHFYHFHFHSLPHFINIKSSVFSCVETIGCTVFEWLFHYLGS
jgi:hypothetical protein